MVEIKPLAELPTIVENNEFKKEFVIETYKYNSISYEDFFNNHLRKNVPCIIKDIATDWEATKTWVTNDKINEEYLINQYGDLTVSVTDCKELTFDCQPKTDMTFSDYMTYWKTTEKEKLLYLKDWHLRRMVPEDQFYIWPELFGSDWLNEFSLDNEIDDYMFVYMGPAGTWTPLHADVYKSFSWSVNIAGRKKWILFPPGEEEKLKDKHNNLPLQFEPEKFKEKNVVYYEIVQEKGDAIFVPSNWYHQVVNEVDTISINHNWINGCNLLTVWDGLLKELAAVEKEIDDLKDLVEFPLICQNMLKNLYGMNCEDFANFVTYIGEKRVAQVEVGPDIVFDSFPLGNNHMMYDLKQIQCVIELITQHSTYTTNVYQVTENFILLEDCLTYLF